MANFKVGDKVKIHPDASPCGGLETTITGPSFEHWSRPGATFWPVACHEFGAFEGCLIPLTPPAEDAWAADKVKQVTKPQHTEPVAPVRVPAH